MIPKGAWSIVVGLLMLALNLTRYLNKIRMSGFTTILSILALIGGMVEYLGWKSLDGAFILIIVEACLIVKPWVEKQGLFEKAEQS